MYWLIYLSILALQQCLGYEDFWEHNLPGTKWCGVSNVAMHYDDLGYYRKTDVCCRGHDLCTDFILGFRTKYNLTNTSKFSQSHCSCDEKFRQCLKSNRISSSKFVGIGFFDVLQMRCFLNTYPATCVKWTTFQLRQRCLKYIFDKSKPMVWQWFDNPRYYSKRSLFEEMKSTV